MLENRKAYRIPFKGKFVYGTSEGVYTGNALNISAGGIFVGSLDLLRRETRCRILFQLRKNEDPIAMEAIVKRVSQSTADPEHIPGLGFQFVGDGHVELKQKIEDFMAECRKNYEVAATILSHGEPDLSSIQNFLQNLYVPQFQDLGELRQYIERVLRAIEMVDKNLSGDDSNLI